MRTNQEIIKEINDTQNVYDRLIMEIGQLYATHKLTNNQNLVFTINEKVQIFQKVELHLKELEQELTNIKE